MRSALIVLTAAASIVALNHLLQRPAPTEPPPRSPTGTPVVLGASPASNPESHETHEQDGVQVRRAPAAATAVARRFLDAYLRWEAGDTSSNVDRTLTAAATPRLRGLLGSGRGQPTPGGKVSRAELVSLIAGSAPEGRAATIAARLQRNARRSDLAIVVRRIDGRWQVDALSR